MIKKFFSFVFTIALISFSAYLIYYTVAPGCHVGVQYSIGDIPNRFNLSHDDALAAAESAAAVWNKARGEQVIEYEPESNFSINFVYDERQEQTIERLASEDVIDTNRGTIEEVFAELEGLRDQFSVAESAYIGNRNQYRDHQNQYNQAVARYNETGEGSVADLEAERERLQQEYQDLEQERRALNKLATELNAKTTSANSAVEHFNSQVSDFNDRYSKQIEPFKQGIYNRYGIEVYQYETKADLVALLVHEFGHALGMGHVQEQDAIMYYLQHEDQAHNVQITAADLAELERVCEAPWWRGLSIDHLRQAFLNR